MEVVNHPAHYNSGGIEVIDVIEDWGLGFSLGNALKYICRAGRKTNDPTEDLKKAQWYIRRAMWNRESCQTSGDTRIGGMEVVDAFEMDPLFGDMVLTLWYYSRFHNDNELARIDSALNEIINYESKGE